MSGGITGCRRGLLRVRDWLPILALLFLQISSDEKEEE